MVHFTLKIIRHPQQTLILFFYFTPANRRLPRHLLLMSHLNPSPKSPNRDQIEKKDPQPSDRSLPEPPPHHTSKLTATKFARAVRGAWKHTGTKTKLRKTHSPQTKASSLFHLCLPKPPPHHTPKLTATEFAKAVHGAWKQTGAVVSHDPNVRFS